MVKEARSGQVRYPFGYNDLPELNLDTLQEAVVTLMKRLFADKEVNPSWIEGRVDDLNTRLNQIQTINNYNPDVVIFSDLDYTLEQYGSLRAVNPEIELFVSKLAAQGKAAQLLLGQDEKAAFKKRASESGLWSLFKDEEGTSFEESLQYAEGTICHSRKGFKSLEQWLFGSSAVPIKTEPWDEEAAGGAHMNAKIVAVRKNWKQSKIALLVGNKNSNRDPLTTMLEFPDQKILIVRMPLLYCEVRIAPELRNELKQSRG